MAKDMEAKRLILSPTEEVDIFHTYKKARKASYKGNNAPLSDFYDCFGEDIARVCRNLAISDSKKRTRVFKKIGHLISSGKCFFATFTFKNECLAFKEETRRKYVTRALKAECPVYVANIDFGKEHGREHYHALCFADTAPTFADYASRYGFVNVEKIRTTPDDMKRVQNYTLKLGRHALKETGRNKRIIYSRRVVTV